MTSGSMRYMMTSIAAARMGAPQLRSHQSGQTFEGFWMAAVQLLNRFLNLRCGLASGDLVSNFRW